LRAVVATGCRPHAPLPSIRTAAREEAGQKKKKAPLFPQELQLRNGGPHSVRIAVTSEAVSLSTAATKLWVLVLPTLSPQLCPFLPLSPQQCAEPKSRKVNSYKKGKRYPSTVERKTVGSVHTI